jgi:hypothetical protein
MRKIALFFVGLGFLLLLVGAGTSDMEIATTGEGARLFTGIPLAVLGLVVLAAGAMLLSEGGDEPPKGRRAR